MNEIVLTGRITGAKVNEVRNAKASGKEYKYNEVTAFVDEVGRVKFNFNTIQDEHVAGKAKREIGNSCKLVCVVDVDNFGSPRLVLTDISE